jgi:hypothetical protein
VGPVEDQKSRRYADTKIYLNAGGEGETMIDQVKKSKPND